MAHVEILTRDGEVPPEWNGMVRHALQRISDSEKGWQGPVETIEITRLIEGGRSEAVVIEVALRAGDEYRQRVVKIGPATEMAAEYANFSRFLAQYPATVCAPILEATPGAADPAEQRDGEVEAVVYTHVTDYAGRPRTPAPTLEDLVHRAFRDLAAVPEVQQVIAQLFTMMSIPFHNRRKVWQTLSLRDLNPSLGPDLVLEAAAVETTAIYAEDVLDGSLGSREFRPGQELRVAASGSREIRVETHGGSPGTEPAGRVLRSRFPEQRAKLDGAFTTVERDGSAVVADGVRTADPAGGLRPALTDPRFGRVRGVVHGDLNARNVMCVDSRPMVIDFAQTAENRPVLSDAAWLEISLLRDVFAELPYGELVRLQRLLALATRIRPLVNDVTKLEVTFDDLFEGPALAAFRILHELRARAQQAFPVADAWLDYLAQVHLSAYRTVKWHGQAGLKLRAVHAAAAVATEWLTGQDPLAHWEELPDLLRRLSPIMDLTHPDAVTVVTGLLTAVDARHPGAEAPGVDVLRNRFVRARYVEQARELVVELSREHGNYLDTGEAGNTGSAVVVGGPGAGKSRLLRELAYQGAIDIAGPGWGLSPLRVPLFVTAAGLLPNALPLPHEALVLGAAHILLDGLDEVSAEDRDRIATWSRDLLARFPRVRLTVAVRNGAWAAGAFALPVIRLFPWNEGEVSWFLRGFAFPDGVRHSLESDIHDVHHSDGGAPPGFVTMVAETTAKERWPLPIGDSYEKYFAGDLTEDDVATLASLATAAVDTSASVRPDVDVSAFLDRGILDGDEDGVRFARLAERDFFAAQALLAGGDFVRERARAFAWRDVCLLAAKLPSTPDAVVDLIVDSVGVADLHFTARLLSFRPTMAAARMPIWTALLTDPAAGPYTHRSAAEALRMTGIPPARRALGEILLKQATPVSTKVEILHALEPGLFSEPDGPGHQQWLRHVLGAVLTGDHPAEILVAAISVIDRGGVRGLEVLLADQLRSGEPLVAAAADRVLRSSEVVVPRSLETIRAELVLTRLKQVEAQLPALSGGAAIRAAGEERLQLLEQTKSGTELLRRRFSYGINAAVADALAAIPREQPFPVDASRLADLPADEARAAAHWIISEAPKAPGTREALVLSARVDSPLHLLLIAAEAVSSPAAVEHAASLVTELAEVVTADRIEGLAALGHAVTNYDRRRGFTVTRHAARVLHDRGLAARRNWPWITMMAHTSPHPDLLDDFLAEGIDDAVEELARYAPTGDGQYQRVRLSAAARAFVLGSHRDNDVRWALAAAAAGLAEAVSAVLEIAGNRELATVAETISTGRYGIVEMAPHGHVLAALGGLARETGEVTEAHRLLEEFDTAGMHSSVEAGRLAGLAFLGDCEPLLRAAPGDGGPLDMASHQAIRRWLPGPCSPDGFRGHGDVAARLLEVLSEPGMTPGRRSLLEELINKLEQSHGKLLAR
ncbi:hypothetical protein ACIOD2_21805 [Amycolatopsis sp. NPDC088138]|uniref:hypothetical protein n=1 Tax=Amycolatopsis sp. NPDC088138 TaxID=3363938 RepID=UPI0038203B9F